MLSRSDNFVGSPVPLAEQLKPALERRILEFVLEGFEHWRQHDFVAWDHTENAYTIRLLACMRQVKRDKNLAFAPRREQPEDSPEALAGDASPNRSPRIDIAVGWGQIDDESAYYTVECKRLSKGQLAGRYVTDGMMRFVDGRYARAMPLAGMAAYVVSGDLETLWENVNAAVQGCSALGATDMLGKASPILGLKTVYESRHDRVSIGSKIRVTHLFLDLRTRPQIRKPR